MKLTLTKSEAVSMILNNLGLATTVEVVITEEPNIYQNLIEEIDKMAYSTADKIKAIKRFREVIPCDLINAKWAIEHWNTVYSWISQHEKAPHFTGDYHNNSIRLS